jgi:hypothetical protein
MSAPKTILGPVMRSFDMQLKMPRVRGKSIKAGLVFKSLARSKPQPISESVEAHGVDDWDEGLNSGDMSSAS